MNEETLIARLRALLGSRCRHRGGNCRLVDLLPAEGILVLECEDREPLILADQYGRPSYRANELLQIAIFDGSRDLPSAQIDDLLADLEAVTAR